MNWELIFALMLGILVGYVVAAIFRPKHEVVGDLHIVEDEDVEKPYLFVELKDEKTLDRIYNKKHVAMRVRNKTAISQK